MTLRKIHREYGIALPDEPILSLLEGPHREAILSAFSSLGMSAPDAISDAHVLTEMRRVFFVFKDNWSNHWHKRRWPRNTGGNRSD